MSEFIVNRNHPIIQREQTYFLDRKMLSIHSEDRDVDKWPNSNNFQLQLPQDLINVYSIRLVNVSIPSNLYVFSNNYQNTKLELQIIPDISGTSNEKTVLQDFFDISGLYSITIDEGYYEPEELALELERKINKSITEKVIELSPSIQPYTYTFFRVKYNKVQHKLFIINVRDNFILNFSNKIVYTGLDCYQKIVFEQPSNWGLPYNLGFDKKDYTTFTTPLLSFDYEPSSNFIADPSSNTGNVYYQKSVDCIDIFGSDSIYVELDKYNSLDEIEPYRTNTTTLYNNNYNGNTNRAFAKIGYSGKANSAFAKLSILKYPFNQISDSKNNYLNNITFFKVPIPKIRTLLFKFRFHDGRLVDFKRMNFSLMLEINQLIDEQHRSFSLNVPFVYPS